MDPVGERTIDSYRERPRRRCQSCGPVRVWTSLKWTIGIVACVLQSVRPNDDAIDECSELPSAVADEDIFSTFWTFVRQKALIRLVYVVVSCW